MIRKDLLALTPDDLATLANRGILKRAQRDLESGIEPLGFDVAPDGTVKSRWSDDAVVTLKPNEVLGERCCTCAAMSICRHIVQTILIYQITAEEDAAEEKAPAEPWDPGEITDASLAAYWKPNVYASIEKQWRAGMVAELHRSAKPRVRLHTLGITLRFLVPHDARYVQCDCADEQPCRHVALAVWSFRQLPKEQAAGLITTEKLSPPGNVTEDCETLAESLFAHGLSQLPPTHLRQLEFLPSQLHKDSLIWPAEIAEELLVVREQYLQRDARFDPAWVIRLVGELLIRMRAIRAATGHVPQLFLRGSKRDEPAELASARLIALGLQVEVRRRSAVLTVPLQDLATGSIVVARREFVTPEVGEAKAFADLARNVFAKRIALDTIATGQLLIQGAKRSVNGELAASRAAVAINPQAYEWEKLRSPILVESFEELRAHREALPPATMRPRRAGENLHVCPVTRVEMRTLDPATRRIEATLVDSAGDSILLVHPYYSRGRNGFLQLWNALEKDQPRFVAGIVRGAAKGLTIEPTALVVESGGARRAVLPWIAANAGTTELPIDQWPSNAPQGDALGRFLAQVEESLGEAVLIGLERGDEQMARRWAALIEEGEQLGLDRVLNPARRLQQQLASRRGTLDWDPTVAVKAAIELAVLLTFGSAD